jgi:hypothetical protein
MPEWRPSSKGPTQKIIGSAWGGCGVDQCRVRQRSGKRVSCALRLSGRVPTPRGTATRRRTGGPRRGRRVRAPLLRGEPARRAAGCPLAPGAGAHRALRYLLAHDRRAGPRRPHGLAQQQPVHRPPVLARPPGPGPPQRDQRRRDRHRVRRPPSRDLHRWADPPDGDRVPPERSPPPWAQDLERAAHALRGLPRREHRRRRPPQPRLHRRGPPAGLERRRRSGLPPTWISSSVGRSPRSGPRRPGRRGRRSARWGAGAGPRSRRRCPPSGPASRCSR